MRAFCRCYSSYCWIWKYCAYYYLWQDCILCLCTCWSHLHVSTSYLLYENDGTIFTIGISTFIAVFALKTLINSESTCFTYRDIILIFKSILQTIIKRCILIEATSIPFPKPSCNSFPTLITSKCKTFNAIKLFSRNLNDKLTKRKTINSR